jgi:hypothetical protein
LVIIGQYLVVVIAIKVTWIFRVQGIMMKYPQLAEILESSQHGRETEQDISETQTQSSVPEALTKNQALAIMEGMDLKLVMKGHLSNVWSELKYVAMMILVISYVCYTLLTRSTNSKLRSINF